MEKIRMLQIPNITPWGIYTSILKGYVLSYENPDLRNIFLCKGGSCIYVSSLIRTWQTATCLHVGAVIYEKINEILKGNFDFLGVSCSPPVSPVDEKKSFECLNFIHKSVNDFKRLDASTMPEKTVTDIYLSFHYISLITINHLKHFYKINTIVFFELLQIVLSLLLNDGLVISPVLKIIPHVQEKLDERLKGAGKYLDYGNTWDLPSYERYVKWLQMCFGEDPSFSEFKLLYGKGHVFEKLEFQLSVLHEEGGELKQEEDYSELSDERLKDIFKKEQYGNDARDIKKAIDLLSKYGGSGIKVIISHNETMTELIKGNFPRYILCELRNHVIPDDGGSTIKRRKKTKRRQTIKKIKKRSKSRRKKEKKRERKKKINKSEKRRTSRAKNRRTSRAKNRRTNRRGGEDLDIDGGFQMAKRMGKKVMKKLSKKKHRKEDCGSLYEEKSNVVLLRSRLVSIEKKDDYLEFDLRFAENEENEENEEVFYINVKKLLKHRIKFKLHNVWGIHYRYNRRNLQLLDIIPGIVMHEYSFNNPDLKEHSMRFFKIKVLKENGKEKEKKLATCIKFET